MNDTSTHSSTPDGGDTPHADSFDDWSVSETLSGRRILVTGATGFLGKVFASMLLHDHPDIERLSLLIRSSGEDSPRTRFEESLVRSPAFDPLREIYGMGLDDFLDETVTIVEGDITEPNLGLQDEHAAELADQLDLFVNCAGLTNFNPNLEHALSINTLSQRRILEFCRRSDDPAKYLHVSTAFVAGNRSGPIPEKLPDETDYPKYDELKVPFDYEREIEDCLALIDHAERMADDQEHQSRFATRAREQLRRENRPPDDDEHFEQAFRDARRSWLRDYLSDEGMDRAAHWGWPNIYTYTKSLGERILADADDVDVSVCRPAIIESSVSYPEAGWVEGVNTSGPLSYLMYKGHRFIPTRKQMKIDIIPVDFVAGTLTLVSAGLLTGRASDVYHLGSSDRNPVSGHRMVELTSLGNRKVVGADGSQPVWQKTLSHLLDSVPVEPETFRTRSAPKIKEWTEGVGSWLDDLPTDRLGPLGSALDGLKQGVDAANRAATSTEYIVDIFLPFIAENNYEFVSRNIDDLVAGLPAPEQRRYGPKIDDLNWRDYWVNTHIPALAEHIFPRIERRIRQRGDEPLTYESLIELFDASTANYGDRVALQHQRDGEIVEQYTYDELERAADRAARLLRERGIEDDQRVLLASENRPQWGMAYFGILRAGGVPVPVDPDSSAEELTSFVASSDAAAVILSAEVHDRLGEELSGAWSDEERNPEIVEFADLFAERLPAVIPDREETSVSTPEVADAQLPARRPRGDSLASLIFTSGTTGDPKGVRLTHQNFTQLLKNLNSVFDIDERDRFVSVLPLHHTFEFSSGFLMPLSQGATITYLEERDGEELTAALRNTEATAVVGVPALWELVERRIREQLEDAPPAVRQALRAAMQMNRELRESGVGDLGRILFAPVHRALGGSLRYLVSGGAPLSDEVQQTFRSLGFDMLEGYGLTEAAPVLTVDRPSEQSGTEHVGRPLPDVDIKIDNPGEDGVGEILARGPNVMEGYLDDSRTDDTFDGEWLRTGDLGRIDDKGRLEIVGREKDVIVTPGGKNVYPDELEDVYADHERIGEICVVGLERSDGGQRVAALVHPAVPEEANGDEIRSDIRDHFSVQASRLASHKKIRTLRFWDQPLPKTATRKIQRSEVKKILRRILKTERREAEERSDGVPAWMAELLADLGGVAASEVTPGTHLYEDLGFDSLILTEAAGHIRRHASELDRDELAEAERVADLIDLVDARSDDRSVATNADEHGSEGDLVPVDDKRYQQVETADVPESVARAGRRILGSAQWSTYDRLYNVDVYGEAHIPWNDPNVLVVANHCSHLDMGLVKYALGSFGQNIRALAAADYFFEDPLRKTYFEQFTNLIPLDRSGSLEEALEEASLAIKHGETLLIFPEGTRSKDGTIQPFQAGLGYLVATHNIDVLPLYLDGTYEAFPKGQVLPSPFKRDLSVHIGQMLTARELVASSDTEHDKQMFADISDVAREAVLDLRDAAEGYDRHTADVSPLFEELRNRYRADHADEPTSFYFSLGDLDAFKWTVLVDPPEVDVRRGKPDDGDADCVIKTSPEMFRRIVEEQYVPSVDEFVSGDIKTNDPDLLRDFQKIFDLQ